MDYTTIILKSYVVVWIVIITVLVIGTELVGPDNIIKRCVIISGIVSVLTFLLITITMGLM